MQDKPCNMILNLCQQYLSHNNNENAIFKNLKSKIKMAFDISCFKDLLYSGQYSNAVSETAHPFYCIYIYMSPHYINKHTLFMKRSEIITF